MAIRMTCTGCESVLNLADNLRGKKVRCKKCGLSLKVPDDDVDEVDDAVQEEPKLKVKSKKAKEAAAADDADDDEDDDQPAKKKKKKKKSKKGSNGMLIAASVAGLVLLLVGGGVSAFFLFRGSDQKVREGQQAKADANKQDEKPGFQFIPKPGEGSPTKKGGKGVVNSVRGAVYRATIRNDLAGINRMHSAFHTDFPNKNNHTREKFLEYIKRDFPTAFEGISEGYYRVNLKAQLGSNDILAGERDEDNAGHLVVRCNATIEYVPAAEWKRAMGL